MQAKRLIFRIHSWLGISIGFVLGIMGLTGASLQFQEEIKTALSPGIATIAVGSSARLRPDELLAQASAQRGGLRPIFLVLPRNPGLSARVFFLPDPKVAASAAPSYVDPASGRLLGPARGEAFFDTCEALHRWLALPGREQGAGGTITGIAALCMLFFACSGLYLRWPRQPLDWRQWLRLDLRRKNMVAWSRTLHIFVGTWVLLVYLFSASTGLWFAFNWYQQLAARAIGAHVQKPAVVAGPSHGATPQAVAAAWQQVQQDAAGKYDTYMVRLSFAGEPFAISGLLAGPARGAEADEYSFDATTGALLRTDLYANRSAGDVMAKSPVYVHIGSIFGLPGRLVFFLAALSLPLFPISGLLMYRARRR